MRSIPLPISLFFIFLFLVNTVKSLSKEVDVDCEHCSFPHWLSGGVWRTFGVERNSSGKWEFDKVFTSSDFKVFSISDGTFPQETCTPANSYGSSPPFQNFAMFNCSNKYSTPENKTNQFCLWSQLEGFETLDVAFMACNHTGWPAPYSFEEAMTGYPVGNFWMLRCKENSDSACNFTILPKRSPPPTPGPIEPFKISAEIMQTTPKMLLGNWRGMQISEQYGDGVVHWNFTSKNEATLEWANRSMEHGRMNYTVSSSSETHVYLKNSNSSLTISCIFSPIENAILTYAILTCGPEGGPAPANISEGMSLPNVQYGISRCNEGDAICNWSGFPQKKDGGTEDSKEEPPQNKHGGREDSKEDL